MIKIYADTGADLTFLKPYKARLKIYQFLYDENVLSKKIHLAVPSEVTWETAHITWKDFNFAWDECVKSEKYEKIKKIIGKNNQMDILHLDSAYKTGCNIFLTADEKDIWSKKTELEPLLGLRVFTTKCNEKVADSRNDCIAYIKGIDTEIF